MRAPGLQLSFRVPRATPLGRHLGLHKVPAQPRTRAASSPRTRAASSPRHRHFVAASSPRLRGVVVESSSYCVRAPGRCRHCEGDCGSEASTAQRGWGLQAPGGCSDFLRPQQRGWGCSQRAWTSCSALTPRPGMCGIVVVVISSSSPLRRRPTSSPRHRACPRRAHNIHTFWVDQSKEPAGMRAPSDT